MDLEAIPCQLDKGSISQLGGVSPKNLSAQGICWAVTSDQAVGKLDGNAGHVLVAWTGNTWLLPSSQSVFTLEKVLPGPSFIITRGTSPHRGLLLSTAALRTAQVRAARGGQCFDTCFSQNISFI